MVIGNGDIASVLKEVDRDDFTFFASGVSDSSTCESKEFDREIDLLLKQDRNKRLIYFSTLSIYYKTNCYTDHKKYMEFVIGKEFKRNCIVRLGNITWGSNPNTIINYFKNHPEAEVQDGYRYLIDKEEFIHWIKMIPPFNTEMNITGKLTSIKEIYERSIHGKW